MLKAGRRALLHGEQAEVGVGHREQGMRNRRARGARSRPHGPCSPQPLQQDCSWKRFSLFDKIIFLFLSLSLFFSFSSDNEPLKAVQGTTGVPGSRAAPR